jgi:hypothetical protein
VPLRKGEGVEHRVNGVDALKVRLAIADRGQPCKPPLKSTQAYFVSDGRIACGTIEVVDGRYVAFDVGGSIIGRFHDLKVAVRALPQGGAR